MSEPIDQELLPCPFCGRAARYTPADYVDAHGEPWPFAECESCNTGAPVEFWNRRASVKPAGVAVPEGYVLLKREAIAGIAWTAELAERYGMASKGELLDAVRAVYTGIDTLLGAIDSDAPHPVSGEQKPVAVVNESDDGQWADILPDVSVKIGDKLYAVPPTAQIAIKQAQADLRSQISAWRIHYDRASLELDQSIKSLALAKRLLTELHAAFDNDEHPWIPGYRAQPVKSQLDTYLKTGEFVGLDSQDLSISVHQIGPAGGFVTRISTAVTVTHLPTGLTATSSEERSQYMNKVKALELLTEMVRKHRS